MDNAIFYNSNTQDMTVVYVILGLVALLGFVIWLARFVNDFSRELRILNMEIGRTEGPERRHWIRKRRRLWLSLLPFYKYR
ncbi:MAG: hypothetical protein IJP02_03390 [Oscillospiraceae bacterium]|nr:hypothetical protein [Oscillospiraceae bacterium]